MLWVGTLEPRKNLPVLIDAFRSVVQSNDLPHRLVIVGSAGWLDTEEAIRGRRELLGDRIHFTGPVRADRLSPCTAGRTAAFPSLHEGFGLPVLEAMAQETAVLSSDIPVLHEVGGDAARFLPPHDVRAWGDALVELLRDDTERARLARAGRARAAGFTWERCIERTRAVYSEVLGGGRLPAAVVPLLEVGALFADGGVEAVAGEHEHLGGKREEPPVDRLQDLLEACARGGGVAGAAWEEGVAGEEQRSALQDEGRGAHRVSGGVDRAQADVADAKTSSSGITKSYAGSISASSDAMPTSMPASRMAATAWMWSQWPWVVSTRRTPVARDTSSSSSCSLAASSSTASPVRLERTTYTLFSNGPTTSLSMRTSAFSKWAARGMRPGYAAQ